MLRPGFVQFVDGSPNLHCQHMQLLLQCDLVNQQESLHCPVYELLNNCSSQGIMLTLQCVPSCFY